TYFVSIMPLVLLLLLGWFCARRKEVPTPSEAAFGGGGHAGGHPAAAQRADPAGITDLTRLDILFGLQAAVLVALSLILVGIWGPVLKAAGHRPAGTADGSALSDA
ncbi:MAG: hypothetical protein ACRDPO_30090, partial [Streptosporangiaceae bacterium]